MLNIVNVSLSSLPESSEKQLFQNKDSKEQRLLLELLKVIFKEIQLTNQSSLLFGIFAASTDSALMWMLDSNSCNILSQWLRMTFLEKSIFKNIVSCSSVITISAIDMYSAKGMIEKIQYIFLRKDISPTHFKNQMRILLVSLLVNIFAVIGPAGLIYEQFSSNKPAAIYFAVAISLVNLLSGSFFMLNILEEVGKLFGKNSIDRAKHTKNIQRFVVSIANYLSGLPPHEYTSVMEHIYAALKDDKLDDIVELLDLHSMFDLKKIDTQSCNLLTNMHLENEEKGNEHGELLKNDYQVLRKTSSELDINSGLWQTRLIAISVFLPLLLGLFPMINLAWLHFLVSLASIPRLIPNSNKGSLNYLRYICAISFAVMYAFVGLYSGLKFFDQLFKINRQNCNLRNISVNFLICIVAGISALTVIGLVHDSIRYGVNYMQYAVFISMHIVNINAIRHICLQEFLTDLLYDSGVLFANIRSSFYPQEFSLVSSSVVLFPAQKELTRRTNNFVVQAEYFPNEDLSRLNCSINLLAKPN